MGNKNSHQKKNYDQETYRQSYSVYDELFDGTNPMSKMVSQSGLVPYVVADQQYYPVDVGSERIRHINFEFCKCNHNNCDKCVRKEMIVHKYLDKDFIEKSDTMFVNNNQLPKNSNDIFITNDQFSETSNDANVRNIRIEDLSPVSDNMKQIVMKGGKSKKSKKNRTKYYDSDDLNDDDITELTPIPSDELERIKSKLFHSSDEEDGYGDDNVNSEYIREAMRSLRANKKNKKHDDIFDSEDKRILGSRVRKYEVESDSDDEGYMKRPIVRNPKY